MAYPEAVLFDNDGLLLDTEAVWSRAEQHLFQSRGMEFTIEHKRSLVGSSAEIAGGVLKTAQTETLAASLVGTLLGDLDLTVNVLGIGLNSPAVIAQALRDLLAPLTPTLDLAIAGTLGALGLGVGEADVRVYGVRCDHAVLVG